MPVSPPLKFLLLIIKFRKNTLQQAKNNNNRMNKKIPALHSHTHKEYPSLQSYNIAQRINTRCTEYRCTEYRCTEYRCTEYRCTEYRCTEYRCTEYNPDHMYVLYHPKPNKKNRPQLWPQVNETGYARNPSILANHTGFSGKIPEYRKVLNSKRDRLRKEPIHTCQPYRIFRENPGIPESTQQ